jgi:hypothetical protein
LAPAPREVLFDFLRFAYANYPFWFVGGSHDFRKIPRITCG